MTKTPQERVESFMSFHGLRNPGLNRADIVAIDYRNVDYPVVTEKYGRKHRISIEDAKHIFRKN